MDPSKRTRVRRRILVAVVLASTLGALAACQQLLGLDKLKNCNEEECDASTSPTDSSTDGSTDSSPDAREDGTAPDASDASVPYPDGSTGSDWVYFRMPWVDGGYLDGSGSTVDGGTEQTFENQFPVASDRQAFAPGTLDGGSFTRDTVSNITWVIGPDVYETSFAAAQARCAGNGTRVPSRIELISLLDPTQTDGGMMRREPLGGKTPAKPAYWSSTAFRGDGGAFTFWIVDFGQGKTFRTSGGDSYGVLCVR